MKCGRARCQTPRDDVKQVQSVTLCKAHRMAMPTLKQLEERMRLLAKANEFKKLEEG
jgi:hypothetical protein